MAQNDRQDVGRVCYEFPKNSTTRIRAKTSEFQGVPRIDLREWVIADGGDYRPTKVGLSLREDQLPELRRAIEALEAEVSAGHAGTYATAHA